MDERNGELKGGGKGELAEENEQYEKVENTESISQSKDGKVENTESISQSKDGKVENTESISQSKDGKVENAVSIVQSKASKVENADNPHKAKDRRGRRKQFKKSKTSGLAKLRGGFGSFGATVKMLWNVWGRFKTKNTQGSNAPVREKTLGVPGFEEIACIEAEVPDIMMMDKDRVRTSCKECMKDPPTFPTKEQIKAKLIAADKYYGVKSEKNKREQSDTTLEHEADYYDVDGRVVRPSWRFILERPLVEQYVLMTNYIRKVSVLSELREDKPSKNFIEEEDSGSDTEYKKFEQKFIKEKRELLKPLQKPKMQDMAVQTSFEPERDSREELKDSVSEVSLYPESEESLNSPEASAVTIVTSRDYASPLQSDFDGRTTDKSMSYRGENWWESQATCQPSESFQTSYDSINKNTSSGSDGTSVPIHSTWGKTALQPAEEVFSNESDSHLISHGGSIEPGTHKIPKDSKKVSFSPVVTYYQGPNKNAAVYQLPEDQDTAMVTEKAEPQQGMETGNPPQNQITAKPPEKEVTMNPPEDQITEEKSRNKEELPNSAATERPKTSKRKATLVNILQDQKQGQIVSVSLPADWHKDRILCNKQLIKVAVSRPPAVKQPVKKKISFQEYEEIPDVEYSDPQVSTAQVRTDTNIQTQTPVARKMIPTETFKPVKHRKSPPPRQLFDYRTSRNLRQPKTQPVDDDDAATGQIRNFSSTVPPNIPEPNSLNVGLNLSERLGHEGTESNIQTAPPLLTSAKPRSQSQRAEEQNFDGHRAIPMIPDRPSTSDTAVRRITFPNTNTQTSWVYTQAPLKKNSPYYQPEIKDTSDTHPRNMKDVHNHPSAIADRKPINHIPRIPHSHPPTRGNPHSQQQQSTDTEGPSSSSNEHIKLRASPACFFKVATPTDLTKISVDEFYPDVPEIDAELSQISETKTSSAPHIEIVFANKETALRYMQNDEFHRVTRKDETTILQSSNDCSITLNAPNNGRTFIASAGVGIKIDEGNIETSKDKGHNKPSNILARKAQTKNSSQQSSITQSLGRSSLLAKQSSRESEEEPTILKETQTATCKTDLGSTAMKQGAMHDDEVNQTVKLKEVKPTNTLMLNDANQISASPLPDDFQNEKNITSREKLKRTSILTTELKSDTPATPEKIVHLGGSSKKGDETPSYKKAVNDRTKTDKAKREIEEGDGIENHEHLADDDDDDDDDDELITIQRQVESLPIDPVDISMPHGRTKLYMRTLSALVEETSSVVESTSSSTQEKIIHMPMMARSVEELKTIFEKRPEVASISGDSEMQVEESRSDPMKWKRLSKETPENEGAFGKLASVEMISPTNDAKNNAMTSHVQDESDKKTCTKSQGESPNSQGNQNLLHAAIELGVSNTQDTMRAKGGGAKDDKPVNAENSSLGQSAKNKNTSALVQEEYSVQQISQIDVLRASEIYSNTSMYFSSSEERVAKLTKARTVFQPVTMDDDLASSACSRETESTANENPDVSNRRYPGSSKNLASTEKLPGMPNSAHQINKDSKPQQQDQNMKTNHEGDNLSVGQDNLRTLADTRQKLGKGKGENEEPTTNVQDYLSKSATHASTGKLDKAVNQPTDPIRTEDASNQTKHWLMDVIPILSKNPRFHGFRQHKPVCVKEVTEAEAVKYRQEAVKPVFRFLKRQREMEENKE